MSEEEEDEEEELEEEDCRVLSMKPGSTEPYRRGNTPCF
jgi:hypothetical protein